SVRLRRIRPMFATPRRTPGSRCRCRWRLPPKRKSHMRAYFSQGLFGRDLLGSVVVFLVALPLCMGIAIASGMPPSAGLISGIVGGLIVGAIAGSPLQVSG